MTRLSGGDVARYQLTVRDVRPFLRRRAARSIAIALFVFLFTTVLALMTGAGDPAGLTTFGVGMGVAIVLISDAYLEYDRTRQSYRSDDPIELLVQAETLVFVTDATQTIVKRGSGVSVSESHGAFLVTTRKGTAPVLVPIRHLSAEEVDLLRQWTARPVVRDGVRL